MSKKPGWFEKDKKDVLKLAKSLDLDVIYCPDTARSYDGIYLKEEREIRIDPQLENKPRIFIYTVLHEIGHHMDEISRNWFNEDDTEEMLLKEFIAGIIAYTIYKNMKLGLPEKQFIIENTINIDEYLRQIKSSGKSDRKIRRMLLNIYGDVDELVVLFRSVFGDVPIPKSLLRTKKYNIITIPSPL